jgi:flagella basal body P-ring formation protein FlgA
MRFFSVFSLFFVSTLCADVSRFIDETIDLPTTGDSRVVRLTKSSALISPHLTDLDYTHSISSSLKSLTLNRELLESKLSECIAHRYQASGRIVAYLSREWSPIEVSSNFIVKIADCTPDEICASTFIRFSIWDGGELIGNFSEPVRLSQLVDFFYSSKPLQRGVRLSSIQLSSKPVDILKKNIGSVPASSNINGYELATNLKPNTPLKWNSLSKVTLVRKGQVVDVFASGNGIYVTMKGMALDDGVEGGVVTVRNLSSDKKFQAKVLNENSVKVHL